MLIIARTANLINQRQIWKLVCVFSSSLDHMALSCSSWNALSNKGFFLDYFLLQFDSSKNTELGKAVSDRMMKNAMWELGIITKSRSKIMTGTKKLWLITLSNSKSFHWLPLKLFINFKSLPDKSDTFLGLYVLELLERHTPFVPLWSADSFISSCQWR